MCAPKAFRAVFTFMEFYGHAQKYTYDSCITKFFEKTKMQLLTSRFEKDDLCQKFKQQCFIIYEWPLVGNKEIKIDKLSSAILYLRIVLSILLNTWALRMSSDSELALESTGEKARSSLLTLVLKKS